VADWVSGFAQSGEERIYWESAGDGVPIVFCHGAGSCHLSFYKQVAGIASDRRRTITWDQRGYCNSTLTSGEMGISVSAEDLTNVLQAVGLSDKPLHLVGQAMGALVAAHWAIGHPERVLSLALWDGPFAVSEDRRFLTWGLPPNDAGVQATRLNRVVGHVRGVGADFRERDRAGTFLYQSLQVLGTDQPTYVDSFAAASAEPVPLELLGALEAPVLIGRGEFDHVADAVSYEQLVDLLPNARLVVLGGCGHSPYFEEPDRWNDAMLAHLATA